MVGLDALRQVLAGEPQLRIEAVADAEPAAAAAIPALGRLVDELASAGRGLIMVMGKGGVGRRPSPPRSRWAW